MPLPRFTRNILATSLLLAAGGTFAADTVSTGIPVTDSINTQTLNKNPQNVVVYDLAMLDILDVLGVKVSGLPLPKEKGSYPAYLSKYESDSYYNVGNPFKPDFEVLKQHKPDLIIGGSRAFESTDKLRAVAPTLDLTVDNAHLLSSLEDRTRTLGKLFDKQPQAEQALAAFNKDIQKTRPLAEKAGTAMTVLVTGDKLMAYGYGDHYGFIFDLLGFKEATQVEGKGRFGEIVDAARIKKADPEWIFVIDRNSAIGQGPANAEKLLGDPQVRATRAAKDGHIVYLDAKAIYSAGGLTAYDQQVKRIYGVLSNSQ